MRELKLIDRLKHLFQNKSKSQPIVMAAKDHHLDAEKISRNALRVLEVLYDAGFDAYLVGGGVRDILLGRSPKDFDVVTDAEPDHILELFKNSRPIGRRFLIVHVFFRREIIQVSTFRALGNDARTTEEGETLPPPMMAPDNTYGTIEEDAWRRDFTVNALFYNIEDRSIVDYTGGLPDLHHRQIRMIGDPLQRYHEDPVRLLRALRLSAKLDFTIEPKTAAPIRQLASLLAHVPPSRLYGEYVKLFFEGAAVRVFEQLDHYDYLRILFPQMVAALDADAQSLTEQALIQKGMAMTDTRYQAGKTLNPGFLLAVMLWAPLLQQMKKLMKKQSSRAYALRQSISWVLKQQSSVMVIPARSSDMVKGIWLLQNHLMKRHQGIRLIRTLRHRYFRAALDFLELRVAAGEPYEELAMWWRAVYDEQFG